MKNVGYLRSALACAATAVVMGLGGLAAAAEASYPALPPLSRFLSTPNGAAAHIAAAKVPVEAPPAEQVTLSLTADKIQTLAPDPALGVSNADVVLITLPRIVFSQPVAILGAKEGQQDFFLTSGSGDHVCRAFGYGPRAALDFAVYVPVRRETVLMALDKELYQVRVIFDGDFSYIKTLACKAR